MLYPMTMEQSMPFLIFSLVASTQFRCDHPQIQQWGLGHGRFSIWKRRFPGVLDTKRTGELRAGI